MLNCETVTGHLEGGRRMAEGRGPAFAEATAWQAEGEEQTRAELIFAGGPWQSCDPPLPSHLCTRLRRARGYSEGVREQAAWLGRQ